MFAYVKFLFDKKRLVVPLSSMKGFITPRDVTDFNGNDNAPIYDVYWPGDAKTCGGYYEAAIVYVADTEDDARKGGERKRIRKTFRPNPEKESGTHKNKAKKKRKHSRRQQELDFLEELSSDSEDDLVQSKLVKERDCHIQQLERELHDLRTLNKNLQKALCAKVLNSDAARVDTDVSPVSQVTSAAKENASTGQAVLLQHAGNGCDTEGISDTPTCSQQCVLPPTSSSATASGQGEGENTSALPLDEPRNDLELGAQNMVCLGHGVRIPKSKYEYLQTIGEESRFAKELAVAVWGTPALARRTFSGELDNRSKSRGRTEALPALTPQKVEAVRDAFNAYLVEKHQVKVEDLKKRHAAQQP